MTLTQILPTALQEHRSDEDPYVYFARDGRGEALSLLQFGTHVTPPLYAYGPGARDHDLIHFVFSGCGDVTMGGRRFRVQGGELFLIPAHTVAYYQADEETPWTYAWLGFDGAWGRALLEETGLSEARPVADMADMPAVYACVQDMKKRMFGPGSYLPLMSGALRLLGLIAAGPKARAPREDDLRPGTEHLKADRLIDGVITRLEHGYRGAVSVQALADELKISRSHLSEQFRRRVGCSIKTYVTRLRLEHARTLMNDSNRSIRAIAEACGYDDPLFFSRVFKKAYGVSPRAYRGALGRDDGGET